MHRKHIHICSCVCGLKTAFEHLMMTIIKQAKFNEHNQWT